MKGWVISSESCREGGGYRQMQGGESVKGRRGAGVCKVEANRFAIPNNGQGREGKGGRGGRGYGFERQMIALGFGYEPTIHHVHGAVYVNKHIHIHMHMPAHDTTGVRDGNTQTHRSDGGRSCDWEDALASIAI
jgi:hypothetical protein